MWGNNFSPMAHEKSIISITTCVHWLIFGGFEFAEQEWLEIDWSEMKIAHIWREISGDWSRWPNWRLFFVASLNEFARSVGPERREEISQMSLSEMNEYDWPIVDVIECGKLFCGYSLPFSVLLPHFVRVPLVSFETEPNVSSVSRSQMTNDFIALIILAWTISFRQLSICHWSMCSNSPLSNRIEYLLWMQTPLFIFAWIYSDRFGVSFNLKKMFP